MYLQVSAVTETGQRIPWNVTLMEKLWVPQLRNWERTDCSSASGTKGTPQYSVTQKG